MLINCNALHIPLADGSVNMCVTSPPYYGLRDYGTAEWIGGDAECDHLPSNQPGPNATVGNTVSLLGRTPYKDICGKCGAVRIDKQIGLEQTPDEYIANLVSVFREVWRVMRDDGTLWVNIGDSFTPQSTHKAAPGTRGGFNSRSHDLKDKIEMQPYMKAKDLIGIPWMLAFALRADGWYLRSDIIWAKKNCMPESVKDRPTKSHEYIFLLSKSAHYYYDHEAIKEPVSEVSKNRAEYGWDCDRPSAQAGINGVHTEKMGSRFVNPTGRNKRDVWFVSTKPYKGAHYATFNPELIEPCILAGCPEDGIVLDPFVGSGTTIETAIRHKRKGVGLDLSMKYLIENAKERLKEIPVQLL